MPTVSKRHVCVVCKKKRVEVTMRRTNAKSKLNGKEEWSCIMCIEPKDTLRSKDTRGSIDGDFKNLNVDWNFCRPRLLPSVEEQKRHYFEKTGIKL